MHAVISSPARVLVAALLALAASLPPAAEATQTSEWKDVSFRGVTLRVPADWPVYDLDAEPARCARSDVNAVYLGRQGADALCPAQLIGAAEAVHIGPLDEHQREMIGRFRTSSVDGEPARVDPGARASGRIITGFERLRTLITVAFGSDQPLAEQIAASIRVTGNASGPPSEAGPTPGTATPAPSPAPAAGGTIPPAQVASHPAPLQPGIFFGDGFDTCANPTLEKMQAWNSSPYRAIGIYIGGINHGCKAQTLTAGWVADAARMGWSFMPLYVGLQAPCQASTRTVKIDPASAAAQGRAAADDAISRADLFRLPTGSPLYFDMEGYAGSAACEAAVRSFLDAWSARVRERNYISGVYSSEASGIDNLSEDYNNPSFRRPDVVWTAHWGESKRIFGHNPLWLPDNIWTNHQRIHQYLGGHVETWGGQSINIDSNYIDAPVVRFQAIQRWLGGDIDGVNGDDLVHLCCSDYLNTWLTQGDGTYDVRSFRPAPGYALQGGNWAVADLNGDGRSDLVHFCCFDYFHIWTAQADGTYSVGFFRPSPGYWVRSGSWQVADINGDGSDDLIHLCCHDWMNVWTSNGDGTFAFRVFQPSRGYWVQSGSWQVADVNGDGNEDLVHLCCFDLMNTWLSNGDGTFAYRTFRQSPGYWIQSGSWRVADISGDGRDDLVHLCCFDWMNTWISGGDGTYAVRTFQPSPGYWIQSGSWRVADTNGDGEDDLVHLCCFDWLNTWRSAGDGTFSVETFQPSPGYWVQAGTWQVGDLNADGNDDLVHLCCATQFNTWFAEEDTFRFTTSPL